MCRSPAFSIFGGRGGRGWPGRTPDTWVDIMSKRNRKPLLAALLVGSALALTGCNDVAKHLKPLSMTTMTQLKAKGLTASDPIMVRIYKESSDLEIWKRHAESGEFRLFKSWKVCAWSGELGPKHQEGDRQSPEGFYTVTPGLMNPNSSYHLAFNVGYPNTFDRAHGRTGSALMVHGACSSRGCFAMTDEQVQEIYGLARDAFKGGQRGFQVQILPFRMTPENLARHHDNPNMPFWRMLKEGVDHFEVTGTPPKVGVCGRKYVFNYGVDGLNPVATCPADLEVQPELRMMVAEKATRDEMRVAALLDDNSSDRIRGWYPFGKEPAVTEPGASMPGTLLADAETGLDPVSAFAALPAERSLNDYVTDLVSAPATALNVVPRARMDMGQVARLPSVGALDQFAPSPVRPATQVAQKDKGGFGARLKGLFGR